MPERNGATSAPTSHLTQPDEALRQARATTPPSTRELRTRAGLQWIAQYLVGDYPTEPMTGATAARAARLYALAARCGDTAADRVMWDLRRALPEVRRTDTRDAYAARLLLIVEGVAV